ncbi:hypothetical protein BDR06DRAFT_969446 [Suillus hirtellus]|nr:hypothetical protein BDR06DRAFT_969446 [Suillus hirtellus]
MNLMGRIPCNIPVVQIRMFGTGLTGPWWLKVFLAHIWAVKFLERWTTAVQLMLTHWLDCGASNTISGQRDHKLVEYLHKIPRFRWRSKMDAFGQKTKVTHLLSAQMTRTLILATAWIPKDDYQMLQQSFYLKKISKSALDFMHSIFLASHLGAYMLSGIRGINSPQ